MAAYYVDSNAGAGDGTGSSWANAYDTIKLAIEDAGTVAGDVFYVASGHNESSAVDQYLNFPSGSGDDPITLISASTAASPPTTFTRGATCTTTGAADINFGNSTEGSAVIIGMDFSIPDKMTLSTNDGNAVFFYDCKFDMTSAGTDAFFVGSETTAELHACEFKFGATSQRIILYSEAHLRMLNCSFTSGTVAVVEPFNMLGAGTFESYGLDMSNLGAGVDIMTANTARTEGMARVKMVNTKMPTSWSGTALTTTPPPCSADIYEFYNLDDDADTIYHSEIYRNSGTATTDVAVTNAGTADGTIAYSWKMVCAAGGELGVLPIEVKLMEGWAAANQKFTVKLTCANQLNNQNFWVVVEAPDATTGSLSVWKSSRDTDYFLGAATNLTALTGTAWVTGALTIESEVNVTVTGGQAGVHRVFVYLADDAAETVYVDPLVVIAAP